MVQVLTGPSILITDWILITCAYFLVVGRVILRVAYQGRSLTISDCLLLFSSVAVFAVMILFQREFALGAMHRGTPTTREIKKLSFATVLLYHTSIYFTKFSILAFYLSLFPATSKGLRKGCYVVIVLTILCYVAAMFLAIFWCGPKISRNWSMGPHACSLWDVTLFKVDFAMNFSSDVLIFALPFPLLTKLSLARRQVIALCATFALGLITIAVSVGRCVALLQSAFIPLYVWSIAEMTTAIMVASLPALRSLLKVSRLGRSQSSNEKHLSFRSRSVYIATPGPSGRHASNDTSSDLELIHVNTNTDKSQTTVQKKEMPSEQSVVSVHHRPAYERSGTDVKGIGKPVQHSEWI